MTRPCAGRAGTAGVASWNITAACNYRCSYCTQREKKDRAGSAVDAAAFLAAFEKLPGAWEVKISGGEPFLQPGFPQIVGALAARGHRISVVTNFSAGDDALSDFLDAAGARLAVFSCSLHLEYVQARPFLEKCLRLKSRLPPRAALHVTSVARRGNLMHLAMLQREFRAAGVDFKVQPEKEGREVVAFTPEERALIEEMGGHCGTGEVENSFQGRMCRAGSAYFIVDHEGEAYRCYPARRYRAERLGNMVDRTFALREQPSVCPYRYCSCTVPVLRGLVQ